MAERIIHQLIDDLDQTEIADGEGGSVEFGFRGTTYKIDLSDANIAKLEEALAPFVEAAARLSGPTAAETARVTSTSPARRRRAKRGVKPARAASTSTVRAWAAENNVDVNGRGRLPASVIEAYETAHKTAK